PQRHEPERSETVAGGAYLGPPPGKRVAACLSVAVVSPAAPSGRVSTARSPRCGRSGTAVPAGSSGGSLEMAHAGETLRNAVERRRIHPVLLLRAVRQRVSALGGGRRYLHGGVGRSKDRKAGGYPGCFVPESRAGPPGFAAVGSRRREADSGLALRALPPYLQPDAGRGRSGRPAVRGGGGGGVPPVTIFRRAAEVSGKAQRRLPIAAQSQTDPGASRFQYSDPVLPDCRQRLGGGGQCPPPAVGRLAVLLAAGETGVSAPRGRRWDWRSGTGASGPA